jgi:hypothetical protein
MIPSGPSFHRGLFKALPHIGRSLLVSFLCLAISYSVTRLGLTRIYHVRWEFLTALDYEWCVVLGRVRYRWSLWVCKYGRHFVAPLSYLKVNIGLICSVSFWIDLLLHAPQRAHICGPEHHLPRPDNPNKLSGCISCLPLYSHAHLTVSPRSLPPSLS